MDFNHREPGRKLSEKINDLIDFALMDERKEEKPRDYLGGSSIGKSCMRQIQYDYLNVPKDPNKILQGKALRIFEAGHLYEDLAARWMRIAGFDLRVKKKDGKQFGFSLCDGAIAGHIDGVLVGGPNIIKYPALWECKSLKNSSWNKVQKNGLKDSHPLYYGQVQTYMAFMELHENPAVFTAINKDTQEPLHEGVLFDSERAQELSDRAVQILKYCEDSVLAPREFGDSEYWECRFCDWQIKCWEKGV